jgi:hypothetical protein
MVQILLRAELIKIADQVFAAHPGCSRSSFREQFLKGLTEAGIGLSFKKFEETVELAMARQVFSPFWRDLESGGEIPQSPEDAVMGKGANRSYLINLILAKLSTQAK